MVGVGTHISPMVGASSKDRLRLRHDVLFSKQPDGALFRSARHSFSVRGADAYAFAVLLSRLLDGTRSEEELWDEIPSTHRPAAEQLVRSLARNELLLHIDPDDEVSSDLPESVRSEFRSQIAYLAHSVYQPLHAFAQFRRTPIHVTGAPALVEAAVVGLLRNGAGRVSTEHALDPRLPALSGIHDPVRLTVGERPENGLAIAMSGIDGAWAIAEPAEGQVVLPVVQFDEQVVFGPELRPAGLGWDSVGLRMFDRVEPRRALNALMPVAAGAPARATFPLSGVNAALVGQTAAFAAFRLLTGLDRQDGRHVAVLQNLRSLESVRSNVYPHPLTPAGAARADFTTRLPFGEDLSGEAGEVDADARYLRLADCFAPVLGLFDRFDDLELEQLPIRVGSIRLHTGARLSGFDLESTRLGRLRAALEAALQYGAQGRHARPVCGAGATDAVIGAGRVVEHLDLGLDDHDVLPVIDLVTGEDAAVAFAAVYPASVVRAGGGFEQPGSAGAGYSLTEALTEAVLGAATFCALREAIEGAPAVSRPFVSLPFADEPRLRYLQESARIEGIDLRVAPLVGAAPTWLAWDHADPGAAVVRSHLVDREALADAVVELLGRRQADDDTPRRPSPDLIAAVVRCSETAAEEIVDLDAETVLGSVVRTLADAGYRVLAHRTSSPDVLAATGIETVRVILAR